MNSPYEVIIRPIVSERAFDLMEQGKYTFEVARNAGKDCCSCREALLCTRHQGKHTFC